jgi:hypothetical protein
LPALAIAFAFAAVAFSLPLDQTDAAPTSGTCGDGVVWNFDGDTHTISVTYTGSGTGRMVDLDDPNKSDYAYLWSNIDNIVFGEGVTYVGACAFEGFGAKTITLSSTIVELGNASLAHNDVTELDLKNVDTIGRMAIYDCEKLTSIDISSKVKTIGDYAFDMCFALESVDTSDATSLVSIGHSAFVATALTSFYVPATVTSLGTGIFVECFDLPAIDVDDANPNYIDVDGVVYDTDMTTVLLYPPARACSVYEIPDSVTTLAQAAFATGYKIGAVTIPDTITVITDNAFEKCTALKTIKIPATVTSIGEYAFASCEGIESVDFSGTTVLQSIGNGAFLDNIKLKTMDIPASVTFIGMRAFAACSELQYIAIDSSNPNYVTVDGILYDKKMENLMQFPGGCNMTSFTIPSTVTSVDINSFSNLKYLQSLTFPDSVTNISDATTTHPGFSMSPLVKISIGNGLKTVGAHPFIDHDFFDKDGKGLQQTVKNLKGHTFVGVDAHHMIMDDSKPSEGFPLWAIVVIVIVVLVAIIGIAMWKRSR